MKDAAERMGDVIDKLQNENTELKATLDSVREYCELVLTYDPHWKHDGHVDGVTVGVQLVAGDILKRVKGTR